MNNFLLCRLISYLNEMIVFRMNSDHVNIKTYYCWSGRWFSGWTHSSLMSKTGRLCLFVCGIRITLKSVICFRFIGFKLSFTVAAGYNYLNFKPIRHEINVSFIITSILYNWFSVYLSIRPIWIRFKGIKGIFKQYT